MVLPWTDANIKGTTLIRNLSFGKDQIGRPARVTWFFGSVEVVRFAQDDNFGSETGETAERANCPR
jgi:hypothetical protein